MSTAIKVRVTLVVALIIEVCSSAAWAAGGGSGAGGSGRQRAINSGLPPGELGPPGAVNNRSPASPVAKQAAPSAIRGSSRSEAPAPKDQ